MTLKTHMHTHALTPTRLTMEDIRLTGASVDQWKKMSSSTHLVQQREWETTRTPPNPTSMALHSNAQLHSGTFWRKNTQLVHNDITAFSLIDQDAEMERKCRQLIMACSVEEAPRCRVVARPGSRTPLWRSRCGGRKTAHLSYNNHFILTNYMGGKVICHDNSMCTSNKWHSSFGTGAWQMHTHPHTPTHTFCILCTLWSVIYECWVGKAAYSFQIDRAPLWD